MDNFEIAQKIDKLSLKLITTKALLSVVSNDLKELVEELNKLVDELNEEE